MERNTSLRDEAAFIAVALLLAYGIYQTAGLLLNTGVPVVAVTSGSMEPTLHRGDMVVVQGKEFEDIRVGDIIVFETEQMPVPIVHRVIEKNGTAVETQGDALTAQHPFEKHVTPDQILGTKLGVMPWVGYVKLIPTCLYLGLQDAPVPQTICP